MNNKSHCKKMMNKEKKGSHTTKHASMHDTCLHIAEIEVVNIIKHFSFIDVHHRIIYFWVGGGVGGGGGRGLVNVLV